MARATMTEFAPIYYYYQGDLVTITRSYRTCIQARKAYLARINAHPNYNTLTDEVIRKNPKGLKASHKGTRA